MFLFRISDSVVTGIPIDLSAAAGTGPPEPPTDKPFVILEIREAGIGNIANVSIS